MSEPILERLSRFTPDAGRLDRDALLFATGRSSARPNRGWMTLATLLASTQALSLVLLWPHPTPPAASFAVRVATVPELPATFDPRTSETWANPGLWSARHSLLESETQDRPAGDVTFIDSGPPLRAFGPLPPSLLN
jgi:hypothetical protein